MEAHELSPLLQEGDNEKPPSLSSRPSSSGSKNKVHPAVATTTTTWTLGERQDEEQRQLRKTTRRTSQVWPDCFYLLLSYLQMYSLIQSMSLRWPWPSNWLVAMRFLFAFNLDIWDYMKIEHNMSYTTQQDYDFPSSVLPFRYTLLLYIWGSIVVALCAIFIVVSLWFCLLQKLKKERNLSYMSWAYVVIIRIIFVPLGVVVGRVFHCDSNNKLAVFDDVECYAGLHWIYIGSAAFCVCLAVIFITWRVHKTKRQLLKMSQERHEGYLQLKEAEYIYGLDTMWLNNKFFLFASFKKRGSHLYSALLVLDLLLIASHAGLYQHSSIQSLVTCGLTTLTWILLIIFRPYRILAYNLMSIVCYICLCLQSMLGALVANSPPVSNRNVWLTEEYVTVELIAVDVFWLICAVIFLAYITYKQCCGKKRSLWPTFAPNSKHSKLSKNTSKYVEAILQGRMLVDRVLQSPMLFCNTDEIGKHIEVVNAYCRETEKVGDALHDSLWDLLDELIDVHTRCTPRSLYAGRVKHSIRTTARQLQLMLPEFTQRLAQRELDLILTTPLKRRLLLKMFVVALFMRGRKQHKEQMSRVKPVVSRLKPHVDNKAYDYYDDVYPSDSELLDNYSVQDIDLELSQTSGGGDGGQAVVEYITILDQQADNQAQIDAHPDALQLLDMQDGEGNTSNPNTSRSHSDMNKQRKPSDTDMERNETPIPGQIDC